MSRLHADLLRALDAWIESQPDPKPGRPEAIRRLLQFALNAKKPTQWDDEVGG
jgi:hypothetical protein